MRVKKEQPVAAATPESEQVSKQDRTVAAQHHRELTPAQSAPHRTGQLDGVSNERLRVQHERLRVALGVVRRRLDAPGSACFKALRQAHAQQRFRQEFNTAREQTEHDGASMMANGLPPISATL
ncbi:MAG TPA: hypothetical protein VEB22_04375 [Phycisphaerales bacterium]|nr:hypothetical protein [Phycisphaerales bacterium]